MNEKHNFTGGCFCRAIRYKGSAPLYSPTVCHCESCRRIAGAHSVGWLTVATGSFRFTDGRPQEFHSSEPVTRAFCPSCGTPLTYRHKNRPFEVDIALATLDNPNAYTPIDHIYMADALTWDTPGDGWPRYASTRPQSLDGEDTEGPNSAP